MTISNAEEAVKAAEALLEAKQSTRVDLLQARVEANNARILLRNARNRHTAAWQQLAAVLGSPHMVSPRLIGEFDPDLEELNSEEVLQRLLATSPELAAASANVLRAQVAIRRAVVEPIPNVFVQVGVQYDYGSRFAITQAQVGVPLPVFDRNQENIRIAQAELVAARREVQRIELELRQRLAGAMERYSNARFAVERYSKDTIPDAKESLRLVRKGYNQGQFDFLRLLTTQRTYFQTNIAYLESVQKWWTAKLEIDGLLLIGGLEKPPIDLIGQ